MGAKLLNTSVCKFEGFYNTNYNIYSKDDKVYLVDWNGTIVVQKDFKPGQYKSFMSNSMFGIVDKNGKEVVKPIYDDISDPFLFGKYAVVKLNELYGLVDKNGKEVTKIIYDVIMPFKNGYAMVARNGFWTFLNEEGKEIVKPQFTRVYNFDPCMIAFVKRCGFVGVLGSRGVILPTKYRYCRYLLEGKVIVYRNKGLFGLYFIQNDKLIKPRYSFVGPYTDGVFKIIYRGKEGTINLNGEEKF